MPSSVPVVLLHGFASSFDHGWVRHGWRDLVEEGGRLVVPTELLGHGASPRPHAASEYASVAQHVLSQLPESPVDAIGFSAGAIALLQLVVERPGRFRRLVLLGVGDGVLTADRSLPPHALSRAIGRDEPPEDISGAEALLWRLAHSGNNDCHALSAFLSGFRGVVEAADLRKVTTPTLLVVGDRDAACPAGRLAAAMQNAELLVVPGLDHFSTPSDFRVIDTALSFISTSEPRPPCPRRTGA